MVHSLSRGFHGATGWGRPDRGRGKTQALASAGGPPGVPKGKRRDTKRRRRPRKR